MSVAVPTSPDVATRGRQARRVEVLHIITTLTTGGAERQLELVTARTRRSSAVVALYAGGPVADAIRAGGVEVDELRAAGWRKPLAPLLLARQVRRRRPDVVHVHLLSAQVLGIPVARLAGVPVVVSTEHSLMDDTIEGRPHRRWLRLLYRATERLATHTVAVSAATADRLRRWGVDADRIAVTPLGIDFEPLVFDPVVRAEVRAELGLDDRARVIAAVGRLEPVKRLHVVLRAAAPLLRAGPGRTVLVVAGGGSCETALRALADDLGIADAVCWVGPQTRVGPVLCAADAFVSASADETFGMAVVEALGAGLPTVYAACPALDELPHLPALAHPVPWTGDDDADARLIGTALAAALDRGTSDLAAPDRAAPAILTDAYGAQPAADRLDAVYDRLLAERRG